MTPLSAWCDPSSGLKLYTTNTLKLHLES